jgi:hypothetical protein
MPTSGALREELKALLSRELDPGEQVLWCAQPDPKRYLGHYWPLLVITLLFMWVFPLSISAVGIVERHATWVELKTADTQAVSFGAYLLSHWGWIVAIGVGILLSVMSVCVWSAQRGVAVRTVYAITQHRAIVLVLKSKDVVFVRDYRGEELIHTARTQYKDGVGNLRFESARVVVGNSGGTGYHGFLGIPEVIEVERLLRLKFGGSSHTCPTG